MSCRGVREWLHREVESLDEAQRLLLDDHLAACERCRGDRQRMQRVRQLGTGLSVPPGGSREYGRAISRALLERDPATRVRTRLPRWIAPVAGAALAAAVAIAMWAAGTSRGAENVTPARTAASPDGGSQTAASTGAASQTAASTGAASTGAASTGAASSEVGSPGAGSPGAASSGGSARGRQVADALAVVEEGTLTSHGAALLPGAEVPADAPLRARGPARVRVASMQVAIAASAELRWIPAERAVVLDRGRLEIASRGAGPTRVVTERFEVELDDATVVVDPGAVRVRRGTARIVDRSRRPLAQLSAGASWSAPESSRASLRGATAASAESRSSAGAAAGAGASPTDEAEAAMALAEASQSRGDLDRAVSGYLAVAAGFAERPVAESALYAAARIELHRARTAAARALLTRYLDRYPQGRYADDARRELARMP